MKNPRINAGQILQSIMEDKVFFGELKKQISEKDLPFINMLILTTLRNYQALQIVLSGYMRKKIPNKHRMAQYLLTLAVAEILFMNTAPYAVINETVANIKKTTDRFLGGLANAVLRKIVANKENLLQKIASINPLPDNFLPLLNGYSKDEIQKIKDSLKIIPPLDISMKNNVVEWAKKLGADIMPNGTLRLTNAPKIHELAGYNDGEWWVQDLASSLPVIALGEVKGLDVIDLCSAPGGKTAQLVAKGANVTANDISAQRLETLKQNMHRLGFEGVKTQISDALDFLENNNKEYDIILLDAPCSASGTFRRHPEVLYIKTAEDVALQAELQHKLLDKCRKAVRVGGIVMYSVCSIAKAEGEEQIERFLAEHKDFELVPITIEDISAYGDWLDNLLLENGTIRTMPFYENKKNGMDSFFMCKMKRII